MHEALDPQNLKNVSQDILQQFKSEKIDRRSTIRKLLALGLTAPVVYHLIGELEGDSVALGQALPFDVKPEKINKQFDALQKVISSREVLDSLKEIASRSDNNDRRYLAEKLADRLMDDPSFFSANNIPIDPRLRLSMRIFEEPKRNDPADVGKTIYARVKDPGGFAQDGTWCLSAGVGLCISYGR
jgi:hypothetical protein